MRPRALVHNPAAGSQRAGARLDRLVEALGRGGDVRVLATTARGEAGQLCARFLAEAGPDADVIALGGDGTFNEVVTGAFEAGFLGPREDADPGGPRFGVLRGGTTNVVARDLGMPRDPLAAAHAIASGRVLRIDVGTCTAAGRTRPFLLACGVGFDADAAGRVRPLMKRLIGPAAYWTAAVHALGRDWALSIDHDGPSGSFRDVRAASVVVGNTKLYAGCVRLRAGASYEDGLLDLMVLPSTRLLPLLRAGVRGLGGAGGGGALAVTRVVVRSLAVDPADSAPLHVDAEPWGALPAELRVLPRRLAVLVP